MYMSIHTWVHASGSCERLLWQRCEGAQGPWLVDILSISMVLLTNGKILLYAPEEKRGVNTGSKQIGDKVGGWGCCMCRWNITS